MFIRTERLFLRPGWAEDWPEICDTIQDEGIVRNLAHAPWPCRPEHAIAFQERMATHGLPRFVITLPSSAGSAVIGCVWLEDRDQDIELGWWIARGYWGHGYATEAVRGLLSVADAIGHQRIVARHFHDDPASGRILEKVGFGRTGRMPSRFSPARGEHALSIEFEIHLGEGDGFDGGDAATRMAA